MNLAVCFRGCIAHCFAFHCEMVQKRYVFRRRDEIQIKLDVPGQSDQPRMTLGDAKEFTWWSLAGSICRKQSPDDVPGDAIVEGMSFQRTQRGFLGVETVRAAGVVRGIMTDLGSLGPRQMLHNFEPAGHCQTFFEREFNTHALSRTSRSGSCAARKMITLKR